MSDNEKERKREHSEERSNGNNDRMDEKEEKREEKNDDRRNDRNDRSDEEKELKLFVGNLGDVEDKEIRKLFSKLSDQAEFKRIRDSFGFLLTPNQQDYDDALKMDGADVDGVKIVIAKANKRGENRENNVRNKPSVFVKNLSFDSDRKTIEEFFSSCGEVVDVYLPKFRDRQGHKGFCYVRFDTEKGQTKALEMNNEKLDGRELFVDLPRNNKSSYDRRGGHDRRGGGYERRDYRKRSFYDRRDDRRDDYRRDDRRDDYRRDERRYERRDDRRDDRREDRRDDRRYDRDRREERRDDRY